MRAWLGWVKIHRETVPASLPFHPLRARGRVGYFKGPPEAWEAMGQKDTDSHPASLLPNCATSDRALLFPSLLPHLQNG